MGRHKGPPRRVRFIWFLKGNSWRSSDSYLCTFAEDIIFIAPVIFSLDATEPIRVLSSLRVAMCCVDDLVCQKSPHRCPEPSLLSGHPCGLVWFCLGFMPWSCIGLIFRRHIHAAWPVRHQ